MKNDQKAVFRFRDGSVEEGFLGSSVPLPSTTSAVVLTRHDGTREEVPLERLKAVFLLRPWLRDESTHTAEERRLTVEFFDGEKLRGTTTDWVPGSPSFVLHPEDRSKVEGILIASSAVVGVELGGSSGAVGD